MEKTVTEHPWGFFSPTIKIAFKKSTGRVEIWRNSYSPFLGFRYTLSFRQDRQLD